MPGLPAKLKNTALSVLRFMAPIVNARQKSVFNPEAIYVLLLKPLGLGDLLMISPFIAALCKRQHSLPVFIVTEYREFFSIPGVHWIEPAELTAGRCERALVISPTLSWRHAPYLLQAGWSLGYFFSERVLCNFSRLQGQYDARRTHYLERTAPLASILDARWPLAKEGSDYPAILKERCVTPLPAEYCCIAPYANWPERQYPLESWMDVVASVVRHCPVVLVGGNAPDELAMAEALAGNGVINLAGVTTLPQVASVIAGARVFIGNDSGLSHIAFLTAPSSVAIFGCVGGHQRIPLDPVLASRIMVLGKGEGCRDFPCYDGFNRPDCRNRDRYGCLRALKAGTVADAALQLMKTAS